MLNEESRMQEIFFGDKRPNFECYSITNIDPTSESFRIGARHVSYDNSAENSKL